MTLHSDTQHNDIQLSITTFSIMTLSMMKFGIMTFNTMTFNTMTYSTMTHSIKPNFATLSINDTQYNNLPLCRMLHLFIVILNIIMPSVVMLNAVAPFIKFLKF